METLDKLNLNKTCGGDLKKNTFSSGTSDSNKLGLSQLSSSGDRKKGFPMPVNGTFFLKGPITRKAPQETNKEVSNVELPKYCHYVPNEGFLCNKLDTTKDSDAVVIKTYNNTNEKQAMFSTAGGWCSSTSSAPGKIVCKDNDIKEISFI